jgi:hypothetical protein
MMRLIPLVSAAFVVLVSGPSFAQGWVEYSSRADFFSVNFPGEPTVRDITYASESSGMLPGRIHSVDNGPNHFSVTVVDYSSTAENELRGALDYAAWTFIQRDAKVTDYGYYYAERVEGRRIQLTNADQSRTFVAVHLHENRLYIFDGTVPLGAPPPGLFQQSVGFVDGQGFRVRYETMYDNMQPPPLRVQYGQQSAGVPDLPGVPLGTRRTFTEGPFAGETWGVDGSGQPFRVREGAPSSAQGYP